MSKPFDFNTPITENTTLVARYKANDTPYAGKWFRATTKNGNRYIPTSLDEANSAAGIGFPYHTVNTTNSTSRWHLVNVDTAQYEDIYPSDVVKLELGGGWGTLQYGNFFPIQNASTYSTTPACTNLRYITGYPEGIAPAYYIFALSPLSLSAGSDYGKFHANLNIDVSGLKFDQSMYNKMFTTLYSTTTTGTTIFNPCYYTTSSYGITSKGGIYGTVEPLFDISSVTVADSTLYSAFGSATDTSLNYTQGIGFVGQYAQGWADKFQTRNGSLYRTTYLG